MGKKHGKKGMNADGITASPVSRLFGINNAYYAVSIRATVLSYFIGGFFS
jgi:hypothetical protein